MAQEIINIGSAPNDGTGDNLRSSFEKTNSNFTELYTGKENTITAGTTSQYFRGDKTFQTLDKTAVGLGNVDNTSDLNKPISTATQTALNGKQNTLTNPVTGTGTTNFLPKFTGASAIGNSLIFDDGTNVGIARVGEVSLDLQDTGGQNYRFFSRNSDKTFGIYDATNLRTFFRHVGNANVGSTRLSLMEGGGNVFIGNTTDQTGCLTQIHRTGSSRLLSLFNTTAQGGAKIEFFDGTSNGAVGNLGANLVFYVNNRDTERMRISSAGNVGIATTAPTSRLHVVGLPSYADNAAALAGGLTVGAFYHTAGVLKVVI